jgi:hypothetical protein
VLHRVHAESVDVRLTDPIAVDLAENIDDFVAGRVVVVGIVLERDDVAVLVFGIRIVSARAADGAASMVEAVVAKLDGNRPVVSAPEFQRKLPILEIPIGKISRIGPVVAGVIDDDVENDAHRRIAPVRRLDQVD